MTLKYWGTWNVKVLENPEPFKFLAVVLENLEPSRVKVLEPFAVKVLKPFQVKVLENLGTFTG